MSNGPGRTTRTRYRYHAWQCDLLRRKYHLCCNNADRLRLFEEAGISTLGRGYNLACRLRLTVPRATSTFDREPFYDPRADASVHLVRDSLDRTWDARDDLYLRDHHHWTGGEPAASARTLYVEEIAVFLNRSVWSVARRARELGLRDVPNFFDAQKVMLWTGLSFNELRTLLGMSDAPDSHARLIVPPALIPVADRNGVMRIILVRASAFARELIASPELVEILINERDADQHFLAEAVDGLRAVAAGTAFLAPVWTGFDACSLCPGVGFGRPLGSSELNLDPRALSPAAGFTDDDWRPNRWQTEAADELLRLAAAAWL
jgi:hypothetical protein